MPWTSISGSLEGPKIDVMIDMGNPLLNHTVDGFLKIGMVGAAKVAAHETYLSLRRGSVSKHNMKESLTFFYHCIRIKFHGTDLWRRLAWCIKKPKEKLKKMCKEGAYWGTIAGVYVGMEYGVERIRGSRDWKNAMIGGALTGALVSAVSSSSNDKIVADAVTGGALATAAIFINYLT